MQLKSLGSELLRVFPLTRRMMASLSRIEKAAHGSRATYVGNNRVLVKCHVARADIAYYVEADDRLLSPWFIITGQYETEITNFFVQNIRPNSNCVDVGSNFGYFTCLMARFCPTGRVVGIEADRHIYEIARDNVAINSFRHARVLHAAASDQIGEITLFRRQTRSGNTSIAAPYREFTDLLGEAPAEPFRVQCMRIDDLLDEFGGRLDFMKIDIEGAEPLAFMGASETIALNPQISIVMEWSPGQIQHAGFDIGEFLKDLESRDLRPFDIDGKRLVPLSYDQLTNLPYRAGVVLQHNANS